MREKHYHLNFKNASLLNFILKITDKKIIIAAKEHFGKIMILSIFLVLSHFDLFPGLGWPAEQLGRGLHVDQRQDLLLPRDRVLAIHRKENGRRLPEVDQIRFRRNSLIR